MKKIISVITALLAVVILSSCGADNAGMAKSAAEFKAAFNACADNFKIDDFTDEDGVFTFTSDDETTVLSCHESGGGLKSIEITAYGMFQPRLASYDYMVYSVIACEPQLDYTAAGDMIASMYYEATNGGEAVTMAGEGVNYSFMKTSDMCRLVIDKID